MCSRDAFLRKPRSEGNCKDNQYKAQRRGRPHRHTMARRRGAVGHRVKMYSYRDLAILFDSEVDATKAFQEACKDGRWMCDIHERGAEVLVKLSRLDEERLAFLFVLHVIAYALAH